MKCPIVPVSRGVRGAWRLEGEGRACSISRSLGNKASTHDAAVWQGSDRKGFLEMAGQGMAPGAAPHRLPSFRAWRFIRAALYPGEGQRLGTGVGGSVV